jgi:hypothetical protein
MSPSDRRPDATGKKARAHLLNAMQWHAGKRADGLSINGADGKRRE